jgi:hypothetical protein
MVAYVEDRKGHDRRYSLDDSLLQGMGYAPQVPFSDGLKQTVRWYQDNRRWWEPLKQSQPGPARRPATEAHSENALAATDLAKPPRRRPASRLRRIR